MQCQLLSTVLMITLFSFHSFVMFLFLILAHPVTPCVLVTLLPHLGWNWLKEKKKKSVLFVSVFSKTVLAWCSQHPSVDSYFCCLKPFFSSVMRLSSIYCHIGVYKNEFLKTFSPCFYEWTNLFNPALATWGVLLSYNF